MVNTPHPGPLPRERGKGGIASPSERGGKASTHSIGSLSLRERVRVRVN